MEIAGAIFFWLVVFIGILLIPLGIPGTFIITFDALIYGFFTGFEKITGQLILILLGISLLMEVVEFLMSGILSKKFGASKAGITGAIAGGITGAIIGTGFFPIIGSMIGAFAGAFIGAFAFEFLSIGDFQRAFKAGFGAFLGSIGGKFLKLTAAIAMAVIILFQII
ncbi:MAG: DUF456 family protein [Fidelibacterota bacterium]